jgi:copper chaperone CopZ
MIKKVYKVTGMDCESCAKMIELDLEDAGVACKCDYTSELLEVEFDGEKVKDENIKKVVGKSGYQLHDHH